MNDITMHYFLAEAKQQLQLRDMIEYLSTKKKILLLCTSNRWKGSDDVPKSTQLARLFEEKLIGKTTLIDVSKLNIHECEGNISDSLRGNHCGTKDSALKDKEKNPTGCHRCWASINNKDDDLWKITKELFNSDVVLFFGSVRWGQTNAVYQKLIERLTWLENRHTTLKESNILKNIESGVIFIGQNWNGAEVVKIQKQVLEFYGFKVTDNLSWNWQYTKNAKDEDAKSYEQAPKAFKEDIAKGL